jgi:hypothetical protein
MNIKTLSAVAFVTAALTVPAFAQYHHRHHVRTASYHGPAYFRGAYNRLPVNESFYSYGPEGILDHSRVGGVDPAINPSD